MMGRSTRRRVALTGAAFLVCLGSFAVLAISPWLLIPFFIACFLYGFYVCGMYVHQGYMEWKP